jgi:hypothetical protein
MSAPMSIDKMIGELRAGLEGVTEGPWSFDGNCGGYVADAEARIARAYAAADAAHIARCSADSIRTILDALAATQEENRRLRSALDIADRLIERGYGLDVPKEWNKAYRSIAVRP